MKKSKIPLIVYGALLGGVTFLLIYGFSSLDIFNINWVMNGHVEKDITCEYAGLLHFINSPWKWPGVIENIGYPYGNSIALTGPNAIMGIPMKLLSGIIPFGAQYFGWWIFFCYIMQGVSAALVAGLFTTDIFSITSCVLLFTTSPILAERSFRHCGLAIHFVLLLAYYLYITNSRQPQKGLWWKSAVLSAISMAVFPYFYPMVLGIVTALLIETYKRDKSIKKILSVYAANIAVIPMIGYPIGMFYAKGGVARTGYGIFSLNLNQPFNPESRGASIGNHEFGSIIWSRILKPQSVSNGQYDAFNYLGFGVILCLIMLFAYFVITKRGKIFSFAFSMFKRHPMLALVEIGFTLYALSNVIYFGTSLVLQYPLPEIANKITGLFRSGGRIFYGMYYFIFIFCIAMILKHFKKQAATIMLAVLLVVQVWDISPGLMWKHDYFKEQQSYQNPWQSELMDYVGDNYDNLFFVTNPNSNEHELSVLLAQKGLVTNLNASPLEKIYHSDEFVKYKITLLQHGVVLENEAFVVDNNALFSELKAATEGKMIAVSDEHFNMLLPILEGKAPPKTMP
ncbi:MAG: DUF6311 domain-containing protein [Oscillospiraceae bacterium]